MQQELHSKILSKKEVTEQKGKQMNQQSTLEHSLFILTNLNVSGNINDYNYWRKLIENSSLRTIQSAEWIPWGANDMVRDLSDSLK